MSRAVEAEADFICDDSNINSDERVTTYICTVHSLEQQELEAYKKPEDLTPFNLTGEITIHNNGQLKKLKPRHIIKPLAP